MGNYTLEQLEQVQVDFNNQIREARATRDFLSDELPRLLLGQVLDGLALHKIEEARRQLAECQQILDEIPGALVILKSWMEQAREQLAQDDRIALAKQTLCEYFAARQEIIKEPSLAGKQAEGRFRGLAIQLDRDVLNKRLKKCEAHFADECRLLITAAREYTSRTRAQPFFFGILIPGGPLSGQ